MNVVILDPDLDELLHTKKNKRYRKVERSKKLWEGLERTIQLMESVKNIDKLHEYSFLHYEKLKHGSYKGNGIEVYIIELNDTHYGNKR